MRKDSNSIRGRGLTYVAVDKPCRAQLKERANERGLTLIAYLRQVAELNTLLPVKEEERAKVS